jgi:hypothetical protein
VQVLRGARFGIPFGYACFGRILERMLVEVVEVAVRPASAFEVFRFEFEDVDQSETGTEVPGNRSRVLSS